MIVRALDINMGAASHLNREKKKKDREGHT